MSPSSNTSKSSIPSNWAASYFGKGYLALHANVFFPPDASAREAAFVLRHLKPLSRRKKNAPPRLLDVPCGFCRHLPTWAKGGWRAVGLEIQRAYLSYAKKGALAIQGDMARLPFAGESFDAVAHLFNSFGYFPHAARAGQSTNQSLLAEFHRVLRPGGVLAIDAPERAKILLALRDSPSRLETGEGWSWRQSFRFDAASKRLQNKTTFEVGGRRETCAYSIRLYSPSEMRRMLERAGFEVECVYRGYDENRIVESGSARTPAPEDDRGTMLFFARKIRERKN